MTPFIQQIFVLSFRLCSGISGHNYVYVHYNTFYAMLNFSKILAKCLGIKCSFFRSFAFLLFIIFIGLSIVLLENVQSKSRLA